MPRMETWTTRKLLVWTTQHFEDKKIDSPRVAAEMLLGHVLGVERLRLYMEPERPASEAERDMFRALVARAGKHEPVDYLVGKTPFFGLELTVTPAVLIPRPSTETLIEHVLQRERPPAASPPPQVSTDPSEVLSKSTDADPEADSPGELTYEPEPELAPQTDTPEIETHSQSSGTSMPVNDSAPPPAEPQTPGPRPEPLSIADVGTGSGAIAITLAKHLPQAKIVATDLSDTALEVARQNAADHGVDGRIDFRLGDLLAPLNGERFDYVLSNPPYISDAEWADVLPNVKDHEPASALRSGADGLDHLRRLIADAHKHLKPDGQLLLEMSSTQAEAMKKLASDAGYENLQILDDHERLPRVLVAEL